MRVLVTGGCGYKGAVLVPKLLAAGHEVKVFDTQWFGSNLEPHPRLEVMVGDIRGGVPIPERTHAIIHLAGIANDPCGELDARLTWEVNVLATLRLGEDAAKAGVRRFIFASSASVYGIKDNKPVVEEDDFAPVSDYNKTKMVAEKLLMPLIDRGMAVACVRPATICGVSPRQRLDVIVNLLTAQALENGKITAHCGPHGAALMRPHMHIEDVADLYCWLLTRPAWNGAVNAASENQTVGETAKIIQQEIPCEVGVTETVDKRSYAVNFSKLKQMGFAPKKTVRDAVRDLIAAWKDGRIKREPKSVNLEWMRSNGWARNV